MNHIDFQTFIRTDSGDATIQYICTSRPWRATSANFWQIKKIRDDEDVQYPQDVDKNNAPSSEFIFAADDREALTYSFN